MGARIPSIGLMWPAVPPVKRGVVADPPDGRFRPSARGRWILWTSSFDPHSTGTTLTSAFECSMKAPLVGKSLDALAWNGDRDIDSMLASYTHEIES